MFTAKSTKYKLSQPDNGMIKLIDRLDDSILYAEKCKYHDEKSGITLINVDGVWKVTFSSARKHQNVNIAQILEKAMV